MSVFPPASQLSQEHLAALIHKLRGPLAAISAQAETLAEGIFGPLRPHQSEAVRSIRQEIDHSLHQIEGLEELWLPRGEADTEVTKAGELHGLFENVSRDFASQLENRQITLQLAPACPLPESSPPAAFLQRLLHHLTHCQIALVPKGTHLHLHISPPPAQVGSLEDHPAVQSQLVRLEPLALLLLRKAGAVVVLHTSGQMPSLGLRLPDQWSCWFSLHPAEITSMPASHDTIPPAASEGPLILLADDQDALASVLGNYLQDLGCRVAKASDGVEAVHLAQQLRPALILMDLRMPLLSGIDALRQIRQAGDESIRAIPVACMSGLSTAGEEARCLAAGAQAFLRKPFRPADLLGLLQKTCPAWQHPQGD